MMIDPLCIGPLTKVGVILCICDPLGDPGTTRQVPLEFIFGIGADGISPFEKALSGKQLGDWVSLDIGADGIGELFGHMACAISGLLLGAFNCRIDATITALAPVSDRELIKAMAQMTACGQGCDCGCGC